MARYLGEPLGEGCRIAVVSNDALGNYVVATPLLQMLKRDLRPAALHYYGGTRTRELWSLDPAIDSGWPFFGSDPADTIAHAQAMGAPYDLVVNMEQHPWAKCFAALVGKRAVGPCLGPEGRGDLPQAEDLVGRLAEDPTWIAPDLVDRYPILQSGFIGEIFCRLAYLPGEIPAYRLATAPPGRPVPDVLIATAASLDSKLWDPAKWRKVLASLGAKGVSVGLLGAKASEQRKFWKGDRTEDDLVEEGLVQDLRGAFTLPEVVGALAAAKGVLTIDNGILHLACSTPTPVVGLFRHGIHRLWAPPYGSVKVLTPGEHGAVADIEVAEVEEAVGWVLAGS